MKLAVVGGGAFLQRVTRRLEALGRGVGHEDAVTVFLEGARNGVADFTAQPEHEGHWLTHPRAPRVAARRAGIGKVS